MNIGHLHKKVARACSVFMLLCLLIINLGTARTVQAASGCSVIYNSNGWAIDNCTSDLAAPTPMQVLLDGVSNGNMALVRICHKSQSYPGTPQVADIYANGYIRLTQFAMENHS